VPFTLGAFQSLVLPQLVMSRLSISESRHAAVCRAGPAHGARSRSGKGLDCTSSQLDVKELHIKLQSGGGLAALPCKLAWQISPVDTSCVRCASVQNLAPDPPFSHENEQRAHHFGQAGVKCDIHTGQPMRSEGVVGITLLSLPHI